MTALHATKHHSLVPEPIFYIDNVIPVPVPEEPKHRVKIRSLAFMQDIEQQLRIKENNTTGGLSPKRVQKRSLDVRSELVKEAHRRDLLMKEQMCIAKNIP